MPGRSSSAARAPTRPFSKSSSSYVQAPVPAAPSVPTVVQHQQTLGQSIKQGFGFGLGSSIARSLFGGGGGSNSGLSSESSSSNRDYHTISPQASVASEVLRENREWREYQQCLKEARGEQEACKHLMPSASTAEGPKEMK